jgi:hypothetical protein
VRRCGLLINSSAWGATVVAGRVPWLTSGSGRRRPAWPDQLAAFDGEIDAPPRAGLVEGARSERVRVEHTADGEDRVPDGLRLEAARLDLRTGSRRDPQERLQRSVPGRWPLGASRRLLVDGAGQQQLVDGV